MIEITIEQALYGGQDAGGYRFLARSSGFLEEWLPAAQQLCAGFGGRPAGVTCPECVFAQPFAGKQVAIVQVADQGTGDTGRPGALGFRLLVISHAAYAALGGDPFFVAERFPPPWHVRGELPPLSWSGERPPQRTVAEVQKVLQRTEGPALLGGAQVLVDGGRVVFQRPAPDMALVRDLWMLLPSSTRCGLWPAGFAFGNALGFDALIVPTTDGEALSGYVNEEQAENYPEGRYELNLQIAAEAGNQADLDALFARRSRSQTWRLGLILLGVAAAMALVSRFMTPPPRVQAPTAPSTSKSGPPPVSSPGKTTP